jgi:hypothetical protein
LNGWQQIQDLNTQKSITSQLEFRPAEKLMFNWNIYVGDERSVAAPNFRKRYFTDLYMVYNPDGKFSSTVCAYIGNQKSVNQINEEEDRIWWQINSSVRYRFTPSWSLSSRVEYFNDPKSVQITSINPLRLYIYEDGLTRFATGKYNTNLTGNKKQSKFTHLTNYSLNKFNPNFIANTDAQADGVGSKWSLQALRKSFRE